MRKFTKVFALIAIMALLLTCFAGCKEEAAGGKVYTIVSDNAFAPFESYDSETGEYVGIDMDIMAAIAEDQGIQYNMMNVGFDPALAKVQANQADAVIAGMTINEDRKLIFPRVISKTVRYWLLPLTAISNPLKTSRAK